MLHVFGSITSGPGLTGTKTNWNDLSELCSFLQRSDLLSFRFAENKKKFLPPLNAGDWKIFKRILAASGESPRLT